MSKHQHLDRLDDGVLSHRVSRRTMLRLIVTGAGASLLAACGNAAPAAAPTAAPAKPTEAAKPAAAAPTAAPAAAAAPTAAAAAKPAEAAKPAAAAGAAPSGGSGGQINIHWTKPITFNPLYSTAGSEQGVERLMFGALVRVNDKLEA